MSNVLELASRAVLIGIGATAVLDLWSAGLRRFARVPTADWGMVGRWIAYLPSGRLVHERLAESPPVDGERAIGWIAHYVIGVIFATSLLLIAGIEWARGPTLAPALIFGVVTVVFPLFVLQPGLGHGIAASKSPNPAAARLRSLTSHTVFGIGLWLAALLSAWLIP